MFGRLTTAAVVLLFLLAIAPGGRADNAHLTPSWLKADTAAKRVQINIIAGFNANNSALNFNGYFAGDAGVVVPPGWTVEIDFKNNDAMLPHSLVVTKPFPPGHLPDRAGVNDVAIPRAYTDNPEEGIPSSKTDTLHFTAKDPGDYYLFCGAPGHGQGGMWIKFKVDAAATAPYVTLAKGAEAGRS